MANGWGKVSILANSALNNMFGSTNHSGSWAPVITNLAKGDSGSGDVFRYILAEYKEAGNSIANLIAAFLVSNNGTNAPVYDEWNHIKGPLARPRARAAIPPVHE